VDINLGDTIVIGETRFTVLAISETMVYARREGALPHDITYMRRADLGRADGARIERKEEQP